MSAGVQIYSWLLWTGLVGSGLRKLLFEKKWVISAVSSRRCPVEGCPVTAVLPHPIT